MKDKKTSAQRSGEDCNVCAGADESVAGNEFIFFEVLRKDAEF